MFGLLIPTAAILSFTMAAIALDEHWAIIAASIAVAWYIAALIFEHRLRTEFHTAQEQRVQTGQLDYPREHPLWLIALVGLDKSFYPELHADHLTHKADAWTEHDMRDAEHLFGVSVLSPRVLSGLLTRALRELSQTPQPWTADAKAMAVAAEIALTVCPWVRVDDDLKAVVLPQRTVR